MTKKILFVCTGNVFRSLTAEFAARAAALAVVPDLKLEFSSAGLRGRPEKKMHPDVLERAAYWNIDASTHTSRKLTQELVDEADLVVAMDSRHQEFIRENFGREATLYLEIAEGRSEDLLDVPDVIDDHHSKPDATRSFIYGTMDRIIANRGGFFARLPQYLGK